jgi:hypothetical protein
MPRRPCSPCQFFALTLRISPKSWLIQGAVMTTASVDTPANTAASPPADSSDPLTLRDAG